MSERLGVLESKSVAEGGDLVLSGPGGDICHRGQIYCWSAGTAAAGDQRKSTQRNNDKFHMKLISFL